MILSTELWRSDHSHFKNYLCHYKSYLGHCCQPLKSYLSLYKVILVIEEVVTSTLKKFQTTKEVITNRFKSYLSPFVSDQYHSCRVRDYILRGWHKIVSDQDHFCSGWDNFQRGCDHFFTGQYLFRSGWDNF